MILGFDERIQVRKDTKKLASCNRKGLDKVQLFGCLKSEAEMKAGQQRFLTFTPSLVVNLLWKHPCRFRSTIRK